MNDRKEEDRSGSLGRVFIPMGVAAGVGAITLLAYAAKRLLPRRPPDQPDHVQPNLERGTSGSPTLNSEEEHLVVDMIGNVLTRTDELKDCITTFESVRGAAIRFKIGDEKNWIDGQTLLGRYPNIQDSDLQNIKAFKVTLPDGKTVAMKVLQIQTSSTRTHGFRACAYYPVDEDGNAIGDKILRISCGGFEHDEWRRHLSSIRHLILDRGHIFPAAEDAVDFYYGVYGKAKALGLDPEKLVVTGHSFGAHGALGIHAKALQDGIKSEAITLDSPQLQRAIGEHTDSRPHGGILSFMHRTALMPDQTRSDFLEHLKQYRVLPITAALQISADKGDPFFQGSHGFYIMMPEVDRKAELPMLGILGGAKNHYYFFIAGQLMKYEGAIVPARDIIKEFGTPANKGNGFSISN